MHLSRHEWLVRAGDRVERLQANAVVIVAGFLIVVLASCGLAAILQTIFPR